MSMATNVLAAAMLLLACSAGWAQLPLHGRPASGQVERVVRLPAVAPGDWVPTEALADPQPATSAPEIPPDRTPQTSLAQAAEPPPIGQDDRAVYAPRVYSEFDAPQRDTQSLGRFGTSAGYWARRATGPPDDAGPVFAGLDGPEEVSPAYGGTDTPARSQWACTPVDPSPELAPGVSPRDWPGREGRFCAGLRRFGRTICCDHRHYYRWRPMYCMALGFAGGAVLANTAMDRHFQDWYQDDVRCSGTDDVSTFFKVFGEGQIFVPAFAGLALVDVFCEDMPVLGIAGDFGARASRAYLVGAPPMLLMQFVTGASRPGEAPCHSEWKPFDDNNGVSGHAFMGAVPFITAARMCDGFWLKSCFYILSTFTAWSRVNDDRHYLSQACLGWWMAYTACLAVDQTEYDRRLVALTPIATPEMTGVGLIVRR